MESVYRQPSDQSRLRDVRMSVTVLSMVGIAMRVMINVNNREDLKALREPVLTITDINVQERGCATVTLGDGNSPFSNC